jgi:hypothetical protein
LGLVIPNTVLDSYIRTDAVINIFPGLVAFPELPGRDCSSCEALWRDYRDAMIAHLEAVDELDLAQFMQNSRRSQYLQGDVLRAERKREQARAAAVSHERTHRDRLAA